MMRSPTPFDLVRLVLARLVSRFYVFALATIATVVAIPIFLLTGMVLVGLATALGAKGALAAALSVAWFVSFLACTAFVVARIVRWLRPVTRRVERLADPDEVVTQSSLSVRSATEDRATPTALPSDAEGDP